MTHRIPFILLEVLLHTCRSAVSEYSPGRVYLLAPRGNYLMEELCAMNIETNLEISAELWICHSSLLGAIGCSEIAGNF